MSENKRQKTGGRQKGTPNKSTINMAEVTRQVVELICDEKILGLSMLIERLAENKPEALLNYLSKAIPIKFEGTIKDQMDIDREKIRENLSKEEIAKMAELIKKARGKNGEQS